MNRIRLFTRMHIRTGFRAPYVQNWQLLHIRTAFRVADVTRAIMALRENDRVKINKRLKANNYSPRLLDHLFISPIVTVNSVEEALQCHYQTANRLVADFQKLGILQEITGGARGRVFRYDALMKLFKPG